MNHKSISKRSNGSELSKTDIQSLKDSIKGHVVVKSEATEEEYKASVLRWNQVYIKQAVGTSSLHTVSVLFFLSINIFGPYETIFVCLIWSLAQNYVVYVAEEADITTCIDFVTKHNVDVAVAGGRHSYHGASSSEGLVIGKHSEPFYWYELARTFYADLKSYDRFTEDEESHSRQGIENCDSARRMRRCGCGTAG